MLLICGLLRAARCEACSTFDPPLLSGAAADEPGRTSPGSWRGPCHRNLPVSHASAGLSLRVCTPRVPLGSSPAELSVGRLKQSQVCAGDGETLGYPRSSDPVLGCPFCFPSRLGIHMSPRKQKTALLKASTFDFKQQQQTTGRGFQSQPTYVCWAL